MRSRAAAALLTTSGFDRAYTMQGGISAWEGLVAHGSPEAGMAYFGDAVKPQELARLAWLLEDGSRLFYVRLDEFLTDDDAKRLFQELARAEVHHAKTVAGLYKSFSRDRAVDEDLPAERDHVMEGGIKVDEALLWAREKDLTSILEFSLSLEANAYDTYIRMERELEGDVKRIFLLLAEEEKKHLSRLAALLDKKV
ncbi:MAG: ferritin-like domain-containing protein [Thermodesulfovibrionales bacterium]